MASRSGRGLGIGVAIVAASLWLAGSAAVQAGGLDGRLCARDGSPVVVVVVDPPPVVVVVVEGRLTQTTPSPSPSRPATSP